MKVAVVGNGKVGMATFRELQSFNEIDEIALIGRNLEKIKGEIDDYKDSSILRNGATPKLSGGGYEQTKDADIIVFAAGKAQLPGQSRLDLIDYNVNVAREVFAEINKYNKKATIIVISNPVDIITYEIFKITNRPRQKVIGTGTLLDTVRCIRLISELLDISPTSVNMFVIGEHGDSSVSVLSSLRLLNMSLDEYLSNEVGMNVHTKPDVVSTNIKNVVRKLIDAKGYTAFGVASVASRLVYEIIHDSNIIFPVSTVLQGEYGVENMAISVPCIIGRNGISQIKQIILNKDEKIAFNNSVDIIQKALKSI